MRTKDLAPWNWFKERDYLSRQDDPSLWRRYDRDMSRVFENFIRDFEDFLPRSFQEKMVEKAKIMPRIDVSETDKEYIIEADLPGVKKEDLDLSISQDGTLLIKGKREITEEQKDRDYHRIERSYGSFERVITLPERYDMDKVAASFKDGFLSVKMPKKEPKNGEIKKIELV